MSHNPSTRTSTFGSLDVETGAFQEVTSHGNSVWAAAFDPTGTVIVTGSYDGVVRVGPIAGGEPHLLYGHTLRSRASPSPPMGSGSPREARTEPSVYGRCPKGSPSTHSRTKSSWSASARLTNLRVVADEGSDTGYRVVIGPFPGWANPLGW